MHGWSSQLWRTFGGCVKPYSREANIRIVQLSMSCCHTSWTLPRWHPNSQTSDLEQSVCALNVCSATTWCLCVSVRALNSVQNHDPIGQCQESHQLPTLKPKHTYTHLSSILSASAVSHLTSSFHLDGSLSLCLSHCPSKISSHVGISQCGSVMLCPTLYLLPCEESLLQRLLIFLLPFLWQIRRKQYRDCYTT